LAFCTVRWCATDTSVTAHLTHIGFCMKLSVLALILCGHWSHNAVTEIYSLVHINCLHGVAQRTESQRVDFFAYEWQEKYQELIWNYYSWDLLAVFKYLNQNTISITHAAHSVVNYSSVTVACMQCRLHTNLQHKVGSSKTKRKSIRVVHSFNGRPLAWEFSSTRTQVQWLFSCCSYSTPNMRGETNRYYQQYLGIHDEEPWQVGWNSNISVWEPPTVNLALAHHSLETTICRVTTVRHTHYMLRPPSSFSCSLQRLSNNLRGGVMWEPPTVNLALANHSLETISC
jgi:hypothetical protein